MRIGYHDKNMSSALAPFIMEAKERHIEMQHYELMPTEQVQLPDLFIINPILPIDGKEYYEKIRQTVSQHQNTRFLLLMPTLNIGEVIEAKKIIGEFPNLEYLSRKDGNGDDMLKKLIEVLDSV